RIHEEKVELVGRENWAPFERSVLRQPIHTSWRSHLSALDHLRQGIHLRGYAQKDPQQASKRQALELLSAMLDRVRDEVVKVLLTVRIPSAEQVEVAEPEPSQLENVKYHHSDYDAALSGEDPGIAEAATGRQAVPDGAVPKVGRNDPCPCGSGKKYKQCHGKLN